MKKEERLIIVSAVAFLTVLLVGEINVLSCLVMLASIVAFSVAMYYEGEFPFTTPYYIKEYREGNITKDEMLRYTKVPKKRSTRIRINVLKVLIYLAIFGDICCICLADTTGPALKYIILTAVINTSFLILMGIANRD